MEGGEGGGEGGGGGGGERGRGGGEMREREEMGGHGMTIGRVMKL